MGRETDEKEERDRIEGKSREQTSTDYTVARPGHKGRRGWGEAGRCGAREDGGGGYRDLSARRVFHERGLALAGKLVGFVTRLADLATRRSYAQIYWTLRNPGSSLFLTCKADTPGFCSRSTLLPCSALQGTPSSQRKKLVRSKRGAPAFQEGSRRTVVDPSAASVVLSCVPARSPRQYPLPFPLTPLVPGSFAPTRRFQRRTRPAAAQNTAQRHYPAQAGERKSPRSPSFSSALALLSTAFFAPAINAFRCAHSQQ